jgi:hypothetical protein
MAAEHVELGDLGEVWKVEVQKAYVGLQFDSQWGAQLYKAGPTGRWRKVGMMVVNQTSPLEAHRDLLRALEEGVLPR